MKAAKITTCLFLLSTISIMGCQSDASPKSRLKGRWDMKYAELNGQAAPLLERMYFQFDDKQVTTNFNEAAVDETVPFEFEESIITKKSEPIIEFEVISLSDSILEMTTAMRGFDFKLVLQHSSQ
ncbi:MAG: hypothetical protein JNL70_10545 [Saprospiraceae bacterium]|nr:hypothetical protein [Saprospiraceae bacterium]